MWDCSRLSPYPVGSWWNDMLDFRSMNDFVHMIEGWEEGVYLVEGQYSRTSPIAGVVVSSAEVLRCCL